MKNVLDFCTPAAAYQLTNGTASCLEFDHRFQFPQPSSGDPQGWLGRPALVQRELKGASKTDGKMKIIGAPSNSGIPLDVTVRELEARLLVEAHTVYNPKID